MVLVEWRIREAKDISDGVDYTPIYQNEPGLFALKIHHGGVFTEWPDRRYVNGKISYVDFVDVDLFSVLELDDIMLELGYKKGQIMHYHFLTPKGDLDSGLHQLSTDDDSRTLANFVSTLKLFEVVLYIEHGFTNLAPKRGNVIIEELSEQETVAVNESVNDILKEVDLNDITFDEFNKGNETGTKGKGILNETGNKGNADASGTGNKGKGKGVMNETGKKVEGVMNEESEDSETNDSGESVGIPETWVDPCYWLSTWKQVYAFKIKGVNGPSMWPKSEIATTLTPPVHHTPVGRPKKKRKRAFDEESLVKGSGSLSRKLKSVTCGLCGNIGHNSRSCKGQGGKGQSGKTQAGDCSTTRQPQAGCEGGGISQEQATQPMASSQPPPPTQPMASSQPPPPTQPMASTQPQPSSKGQSSQSLPVSPTKLTKKAILAQTLPNWVPPSKKNATKTTMKTMKK